MLLDRPLIAFDIETVPDPDVGRRLLGLEGDDAEVIREMVRRRLEETEGQSAYPQPPWHRIVTICAALLGPRSGRFELRVLGGEAGDERAMLEAFFALTKNEQLPPRLVSWNGSGFDLPVIRYRAMLHGVAAPTFYRSDGELRFNNYQNRYHDLHVDLMDVLTGFGASTRVGLGNWCKTLGLPGKGFLETEVYEHVLRGELACVIEYCKLDTALTMLAFLVFAHHRGDLSQDDLRRHVDTIREVLASQPHDGWREIGEQLSDWPPWAALEAPSGER